MLYAAWQVGQVFFTMLWFALFFLWIWTVILVFSDLFRSRDLGGWSKALWALFVLFFPYLGVFMYLIVRGHKIGEHHLQDMQDQEAAMRSYIRSVSSTPASDLGKLTELHDSGVIDDAEFEAMKQRLVTS